MYAVSVVFVIHQDHIKSFLQLIKDHASRTLEREKGCRQFDIGLSEVNSKLVFLFELYDNKQSFDEHSASDYLADFFSVANDWIESKEARRWEIVPNQDPVSRELQG